MKVGGIDGDVVKAYLGDRAAEQQKKLDQLEIYLHGGAGSLVCKTRPVAAKLTFSTKITF
jgi:hypothetical protein